MNQHGSWVEQNKTRQHEKLVCVGKMVGRIQLKWIMSKITDSRYPVSSIQRSHRCQRMWPSEQICKCVIPIMPLVGTGIFNFWKRFYDIWTKKRPFSASCWDEENALTTKNIFVLHSMEAIPYKARFRALFLFPLQRGLTVTRNIQGPRTPTVH